MVRLKDVDVRLPTCLSCDEHEHCKTPFYVLWWLRKQLRRERNGSFSEIGISFALVARDHVRNKCLPGSAMNIVSFYILRQSRKSVAAYILLRVALPFLLHPTGTSIWFADFRRSCETTDSRFAHVATSLVLFWKCMEKKRYTCEHCLQRLLFFCIEIYMNELHWE